MNSAPLLLSVVVPTLNEAATITSTLTRLQPLRSIGGEVIVADGGSTDATCEQAVAFSDSCFKTQPGRARQMNAGAARARGEWLMFLHADTQLPSDLTALLTQLAESSRDWGFFPLRLTGAAAMFRIIERAVSWRSALTKVATGDQVILVRRSVFERIGGFDDIPLMEDIALSKRLRQLGPPLVMPGAVLSSSRRWEKHGVFKTIVLMWSLRLAYVLGVSSQRLWRYYYGRS